MLSIILFRWTSHERRWVGPVQFKVICNDSQPQHMIWLTSVKNIFAQQLPKMPREYIVRLVFDRRHRTLVALKEGRVVGGICFRPFFEQRFAEIAFLAITSSEQVRGYGTRLMNHLKEAVKTVGISDFLTYADNFAIGYFEKQGFTEQINMEKKRWSGYIKDYEGGTLMHCTIYASVNYLDIPGMIQRQKQVRISRMIPIFPVVRRSEYVNERGVVLFLMPVFDVATGAIVRSGLRASRKAPGDSDGIRGQSPRGVASKRMAARSP